MDVASEHLKACRLVFLQQRRPGKTDEDGIRKHRLHHTVQLATLRAMALVDEHKHITHCRGRFGFQILDERIEVVDIPPTEFVDERAEKSRFGLAKLLDQVSAAGASCDGLACFMKDVFDLRVEFVPVGDDRDPSAGVVFQDPFPQKHHDDALAAPLGVP